MVRLTGPDGTIVVEIDPSGTLTAEHDGTRVLEPSPFGVQTPYGHFPTDFEYVGTDTESIEETYELRHGKASTITHRAEESTLRFEANGDIVKLQVRIAEDGVAYRYRVEGDRHEYRLPGDDSGFRFPAETVAWLSEYHPDHEGHSRQLPATAMAGEYNLPGLFRVGDTWALVCEAGVDGDWMAGRLAPPEGDAVGADIVFPDRSIWAPIPATTPWRVLALGDLGTIVETTLPTDLVDGPRIDGDFVEPGRAAWAWWSNDDEFQTLDQQREYVEYAAERGWEYVLVDVGWEDEWLPDLVAYAGERDVNIEIWSHYLDLDTQEKRDRLLSRWSEWGVAGIKVDFMDSDDQGRLRFYDELAADAAEHGLTVNFHGSIVPTGLRRRWPNIVTYEGVRGAEYYKWATNTPEHNVVLPFTRNVVGPMDYTPVTFSSNRRSTSLAHELALSVVYESAIQHYADGIGTYADHPLAETVLEAVPAAWDETRFLRGHPGSEATLARRAGDDWFVGSIVAGAPRTVDVPLSFLEAPTSGVLTTDGEDGLEEHTVDLRPDEPLAVDLTANGGFVLRL